MTLWCAWCERDDHRGAFRVTISAEVRYLDGKEVAYAMHKRCGRKTAISAQAARNMRMVESA